LVQNRKAYFWRKQSEAPTDMCKFQMLEAFRAEVDAELDRQPASIRFTAAAIIAITIAAIAVTIYAAITVL
jgi:hypothetical protein